MWQGNILCALVGYLTGTDCTVNTPSTVRYRLTWTNVADIATCLMAWRLIIITFPVLCSFLGRWPAWKVAHLFTTIQGSLEPSQIHLITAPRVYKNNTVTCMFLWLYCMLVEEVQNGNNINQSGKIVLFLDDTSAKGTLYGNSPCTHS